MMWEALPHTPSPSCVKRCKSSRLTILPTFPLIPSKDSDPSTCLGVRWPIIHGPVSSTRLENLYLAVTADIFAAPNLPGNKCEWRLSLDGKFSDGPDNANATASAWSYNNITVNMNNFPPQLYCIPTVTAACENTVDVTCESADGAGNTPPAQGPPRRRPQPGGLRASVTVLRPPLPGPGTAPAAPSAPTTDNLCYCVQTTHLIRDGEINCEVADRHALQSLLMEDVQTRRHYTVLPHAPIKREPQWTVERKLFISNLNRSNIILPSTAEPNLKKTESIVLQGCPQDQTPPRAFTDVLSPLLAPILKKNPYNFTVTLCPPLQTLIGYSAYQEYGHILRVLARRFILNQEKIPHKLLAHFKVNRLDDCSLLLMMQNHIRRTHKCSLPAIVGPAEKLRRIISEAPRTHVSLNAINLARFASWNDAGALLCLLCCHQVDSHHFQSSHKGIFVEPAAIMAAKNSSFFLVICQCGSAFTDPLVAVVHAICHQHATGFCCQHAEPVQLDSYLSTVIHVTQHHLSKPLEDLLEYHLVRANATVTTPFKALFPPHILPSIQKAFESHITVIEKILFSGVGARENHTALINGGPEVNIIQYFHSYYEGQDMTRERDYLKTMNSLHSTNSAYMTIGFLEHRRVPDWLSTVHGMQKPIGLGETEHPIVCYGISTLFAIPTSSRIKSYDLKSPVVYRMITPTLGIRGSELMFNTSTHTLYTLMKRAAHKIHVVEVLAYNNATGKLDINLLARQMAILFHVSGSIQTETRTKPMILVAVGNPGKQCFDQYPTLEVLNEHRRAERVAACFCDAAGLLPLPLLGILQGDMPDKRHNKIPTIPSSYSVNITPEGALLFTKLLEFFQTSWFALKTRSPGIPIQAFNFLLTPFGSNSRYCGLVTFVFVENDQ